MECSKKSVVFVLAVVAIFSIVAIVTVAASVAKVTTAAAKGAVEAMADAKEESLQRPRS